MPCVCTACAPAAHPAERLVVALIGTSAIACKQTLLILFFSICQPMVWSILNRLLTTYRSGTVSRDGENIMRLSVIGLSGGLLLSLCLLPGIASACDAAEDGCLGCSDEALPVCLNTLAEDVCNTLGNPQNCDRLRIYDDAERYVLLNTGRHMSRMSSMKRSARKYRYR